MKKAKVGDWIRLRPEAIGYPSGNAKVLRVDVEKLYFHFPGFDYGSNAMHWAWFKDVMNVRSYFEMWKKLNERT